MMRYNYEEYGLDREMRHQQYPKEDFYGEK